MTAKLGYLCSSESWGGLKMNHLHSLDAIDLANKMGLICAKEVKFSPEKLKSLANQYDHQMVCKMIELTFLPDCYSQTRNLKQPFRFWAEVR